MARYNIWDISRVYAKGFISFLSENDVSGSVGSIFNLFVYAINFIYYNKKVISGYLIEVYGKSCIDWLKGLKGVPRGILSEKSKREVVDCSKIYALVAIQYYSGFADSNLCEV